MSHAELCPVCFGKGRIVDPATLDLTVPITNICHGCGGCGWITVCDSTDWQKDTWKTVKTSLGGDTKEADDES